MRRTNFGRLIAIWALLFLAACGNDDVFTGQLTGIGGGDGDSAVVTLDLRSSSPTMSPDASEIGQGVTITAIAKDANNNVVPGALIEFSSTGSAEIVVANPALTDETGRVVAVLTTGGDATIRDIVVTARTGSLDQSVTIRVERTQSALSELVLLAGAPTISSDAAGVAAGITLTAVAKDANNNVLPGTQVVFSTADSAEINVVNPAITDVNGRVDAVLTTGGDQTNRTITVLATSSELSDSVSIEVVGTQIDISGPTGAQLDVPTEFVVSLNDAAGNGIPGRTVQISTEAENTLSATSLETDEFGQITVEFSGRQPSSTLTAQALGLSAEVPISVSPDNFTLGVRRVGEEDLIPVGLTDVPELVVGNAYELVASWQRSNGPIDNGRLINFGATRGQLDDFSVPTSQGRAVVQFESTEAGLAILTAFSDELSKPSARITVEYVATRPTKIEVQANPSNVPRNQSSEIVAIVRDANNNLVKNAIVDFSLADQTTGTLSAPTAVTNSQGLVRVTYTSTSQSSGTEGVTIFAQVRGANLVADTVALTVGGTAADIALGTGAELEDKDTSTYRMPFTIVVTDAAGNPVPDAEVSLTLLATQYYEGTFETKVACPNEDLNRNDIFDVGIDNDQNGNGALEPGRRASIPATVELDEDGTGQVFVAYAKTDGAFVSVEITATARVSGTETTAKSSFDLRFTAEDAPFLPGRSPFGTDLNCGTFDPPSL